MSAMTTPIEHYKQGLALYGQHKNEEAVAEFEKALDSKPDWLDALHALATAQSKLGRHDQALAMAQMHAGRLQDALASVLRLTEMTPADPQAFTSLSMIYQRLDRIDDAEKAQSKARMLSWKEELKTNPKAPPPADASGMNVVQ